MCLVSLPGVCEVPVLRLTFPSRVREGVEVAGGAGGRKRRGAKAGKSQGGERDGGGGVGDRREQYQGWGG